MYGTFARKLMMKRKTAEIFMTHFLSSNRGTRNPIRRFEVGSELLASINIP